MNEAEIKQLNNTRNVVKMSLPIFIELMLQLLVGNIDQIMISRHSQLSVGAIVNGNQIIGLLIMVLSMCSMAATVTLSKYLGAQDKENSSRTCMASLLMMTCIGAVLTLIIVFGNPVIFRLMQVQEDVFAQTCLYTTIVGSAIVIQGMYMNFAALLRAAAYMKEVMYVSVTMNIINVAGNAILINGWFGFPQMGVAGAAIATVISKCIGLVLLVWIFYKKAGIPLRLSYLKPFPAKILGKLVKIAIPSGAESFSYSMSQVCILGIINTFGTMVTVTKGYSSILLGFAYIYTIALAQVSQIVIGYLLGAKRTAEIEKRAWATVRMALVICVGLMGLLNIFGDYVFRIFTSDPEVIALGKQILFIDLFLEIGRVININMTRNLIALGEPHIPMIFGIIGQWAIAFLGAYLLGVVMGLGLPGVWIAMAVDECFRGLVYVIRFRSGKWKKAMKA